MSDYRQDVEALEARSATAARLFDIRLIIGGLFVVYGVIVTILGISPSQADLHKAQGIDINLWTGLGMLVLGLLFLLWTWLRPLQQPEPAAQAESGAAGGPPSGGPPSGGPPSGGSV